MESGPILREHFALDRCFCCRRPSNGKRKAPKFLIKAVLYGKHIGGYTPHHVSDIQWLYKNELETDDLPAECLHGLSKWKSKLHRKGHVNKHFYWLDGGGD